MQCVCLDLFTEWWMLQNVMWWFYNRFLCQYLEVWRRKKSYISHLADAFIQATYNWGIHEVINLEKAIQTEEVLVTLSLRHCSNKYKLDREEIKRKRIFLWWSQVVLKEMSFQLLLEDWQGSSSPDGGGRSLQQSGTVNENVLESDFEPLCDGTTRRRSLADLRLLEGM